MDILGEDLKVLILTSYCGDYDKRCTNDDPCDTCLKMCNVAIIPKGTKIKVLGGLEYINSKEYNQPIQATTNPTACIGKNNKQVG